MANTIQYVRNVVQSIHYSILVSLKVDVCDTGHCTSCYCDFFLQRLSFFTDALLCLLLYPLDKKQLRLYPRPAAKKVDDPCPFCKRD